MVKTGADPLTFLTVKRKLKFIRFDGVIKNVALLETCHVLCSFFQLLQTGRNAKENWSK